MMFILILTLAVTTGYAGIGGIAMQEFDSIQSCQHAAKVWESKVKKRGNIDDDEITAICVEK